MLEPESAILLDMISLLTMLAVLTVCVNVLYSYRTLSFIKKHFTYSLCGNLQPFVRLSFS